MQMTKVEPNTSQEPCIFFVWPLEVGHVIDQDSPFYIGNNEIFMYKSKYEFDTGDALLVLSYFISSPASNQPFKHLSPFFLN